MGGIPASTLGNPNSTGDNQSPDSPLFSLKPGTIDQAGYQRKGIF